MALRVTDEVDLLPPCEPASKPGEATQFPTLQFALLRWVFRVPKSCKLCRVQIYIIELCCLSGKLPLRL